MRGAPTIRIDGADIDPDWDGPVGPRAARLRGRARAAKALIRRAVERARGWGHGRPARIRSLVSEIRPVGDGDRRSHRPVA